MADRTPARCAPAEIPTPSSSFASRTRIISGSSSAMRIMCTNHVSGSAESRRIPFAFNASYTIFELTVDTGTRRCSRLRHVDGEELLDGRVRALPLLGVEVAVPPSRHGHELMWHARLLQRFLQA